MQYQKLSTHYAKRLLTVLLDQLITINALKSKCEAAL